MRLFLSVAVLMLTGCNADKISHLKKENKELVAKLEATRKLASLDAQEKCAKQARIAFDESGLNTAIANYMNHYNEKLNKCFVKLTHIKTENKKPSLYMSLLDAFEGKDFAEYYWINSDGKEYREVKPSMCKVTTLSGEEKRCESEKEFDELIKPYMEQ